MISCQVAVVQTSPGTEIIYIHIENSFKIMSPSNIDKLESPLVCVCAFWQQILSLAYFENNRQGFFVYHFIQFFLLASEILQLLFKNCPKSLLV